jgi:uncharacterized protein YndB with AHSA1/START domain
LQEAAVPVIERDVVLPVTRERAWELITEPAELEEWLAEDVDFEAEEGAPLRVTFEDGGEREGVVEAVEPEERVVFRWGDSRVEWRLDEVAGGIRFRVTEHRFGDGGMISFPAGPSMHALAATAALCPA